MIGAKMSYSVFVVAILASAIGIVGCKYERAGTTLDGFNRVVEQNDVKLLDESGDVALFAGKTAEDKSCDAKMRQDGNGLFARRSLLMRRRMKSGTNEWSVVMTAEGDWKIAEGMDEWCEARAKEARNEFDVVKARLSKDGMSIWMVCNPHTSVYSIVCRFDLVSKTFRVLMDGVKSNQTARFWLRERRRTSVTQTESRLVRHGTTHGSLLKVKSSVNPSRLLWLKCKRGTINENRDLEW